YGVDGFVFAFYWSRGKRLLQDALDRGFLQATSSMPFALMWANRMPRKVLPVKRSEPHVLDPARFVHTDPDDFLELIRYLAENYFRRGNYLRIGGKLYFSIFDTNFFLRQMGLDAAARAISRARDWLRARQLPDLHLAAIDPIAAFQPHLREIGFDSVTHYVYLPEWKGEQLQDFRQMSALRTTQWAQWHENTALPYFPSVSPGWDATPRGELFDGKIRADRYPWSPIIVGRHPEYFRDFLANALRYSEMANPAQPVTFIASWNEWSEGHYLEPDKRYGYAWLEAVAQAKRNAAEVLS
ncbi:MAG: hypothetical protein D6820_00730, partial [Lentisphaerae bacterium]